MGQKIHKVVNICGDSCGCHAYLSEINNIIENMVGQETSPEEKLIFHELSMKHPRTFLLFNQINKKIGAETYQLNDRCLKMAIFFEIEKIKKYLKTVDDIEKLEGNLYVLSKTFL